MTRISTTLLPTNALGVPQMELTNASVSITTSGTLTVSDPTAQSSLSTIASNTSSLSGTLNVSDSVAQSDLATIASNTNSLSGTLNVSDSLAQSDLATIASNTNSLSGTLNVSDSIAQSDLSSIASTLAGTLQVSSSTTINGSNGNLFNAASVSNGTQSSAVVLSGFTSSTIYVSQTTGNEVRVLVRGQSSGSYIYFSSIYPYDPSGGSNASGMLNLKDMVIYDVILEATGTDTITGSIFSRV